jgi:hypothetical protein
MVFTQGRQVAKRKKKKTVGGKENSGKEDGIQKKKDQQRSESENTGHDSKLLSPRVFPIHIPFHHFRFSYSLFFFAAWRLCVKTAR